MSKENALLIVATGSSINTHSDKIKELSANVDTLAWGNAFMFFAQRLQVYPTFWWFIDPHASLKTLKWLLKLKVSTKTILHLPQPILTKSHSEQKLYIGAAHSISNFNWDTKYHDFLEMIHKCSKHEYLVVDKFPATSFKKERPLGYQKHVAKGKRFMLADEFRKSMENVADDKFCIMNQSYRVGRLSNYILPLLLNAQRKDKMVYKTIYLAGFDGQNTRYDRKKYEKNEEVKNKMLAREYKEYMPMWVDIFAEVGITIKTVTPSQMVGVKYES